MKEEELLEYGFKKTTYGIELTINEFDSLWFYNSVLYICGSDCPNEDYAIKTKINNIEDLKLMYKLISGKILNKK